MLWTDLVYACHALVGHELCALEKSKSAASDQYVITSSTTKRASTHTEVPVDDIAESLLSGSNALKGKTSGPSQPIGSSALFMTSRRAGNTAGSFSGSSASFFRPSNTAASNIFKANQSVLNRVSANPAKGQVSAQPAAAKAHDDPRSGESSRLMRLFCLNQLLSIHEEIISFLVSVSTILRGHKKSIARQSNPSIGRTKNDVPSSESIYSIDSGFYFLVQACLGFHIDVISKFVNTGEAIEKLAAYQTRDYGCCSDHLLKGLVRLVQLYSSTYDHLSQGIAIIEQVIERSVKTIFAERDTQTSQRDESNRDSVSDIVFVRDTNLVASLLSLSLIYILPADDKRSLYSFDPPEVVPLEIFVASNKNPSSQLSKYDEWKSKLISSHSSTSRRSPILLSSNADADSQIFLPNICYRKLYWRLCGSLYLLGAVQPTTIGRFIWEAVPSVQILLLMSMTGRYYYPPTAITSAVEDRMSTIVGSSVPTISSNADEKRLATLYPKTKLNDHNRHQVVFHGGRNIDVFVSSRSIEVGRGRLEDVDATIAKLEEEICRYYFHQYAAPVPSQSNASGTGAYGACSLFLPAL